MKWEPYASLPAHSLKLSVSPGFFKLPLCADEIVLMGTCIHNKEHRNYFASNYKTKRAQKDKVYEYTFKRSS